MADIAQSALTGGAVVVGILISSVANWLVAGRQSKTQFEQQREMEHATERREQLQRRREVRSLPLLRLKEELATWAQKLDDVLEARQWRYMNDDESDDPQPEEVYQKALIEFRTYIVSGTFERALFQIADREVFVKTMEFRKDFQKGWHEADKQQYDEFRKSILPKIVELQDFISQRLEAL